MLWLILVLMTCVAMLAALLPLARLKIRSGPPRPYVALYRRMLSDIDDDVACGLLDARDGGVMKVEASRRLLSLQAQENEKPISSGRARSVTAALVCLFVPALSLSLYSQLGRHDLPDQPLTERISRIPGHKDTAKRITELEAFIRSHPRDGRAYEHVAPFYQRERRFGDAVRALETALRLSGASSSRYASLGEAKVVAAQGEVPPEAIKDFEAALQLEPKEILARYYLGVAAAQSGDAAKATKIWSSLLADAPKGADWAKQVDDDLNELGKSKR
jgi:cytochrome c-type biogenesis protein CcmH